MTKDPEQIKDGVMDRFVDNLKAGQAPDADMARGESDAQEFRPRETRDESNFRILKAILGAMHDVPVRNRPDQIEALRANREDEPPGRWIHGETNRGKTFCAFHVLKTHKYFTPIKYYELEDMFRNKWKCGANVSPRNVMEWDWKDNPTTCIDDIQNMNLTTENAGLRNELWKFLDEADTCDPRPELIITSNLSVVDFCRMFEGHQRSSLETRIRRLCREVKI